jgi:capsular polysaccharide biosynthesis protein
MNREQTMEGTGLTFGASGSDYASALRRALPVLVIATLVAASVAYAVSRFVMSPVYESSATVIVKESAPGANEGDSAVFRIFNNDQSIGTTFEEMARQPSVTTAAASRLAVSIDVFSSRAGAHAVPKTPLIELSYKDDSPQRAAGAVTIYTETFLATMNQMAWLPGQVLLVSKATAPIAPIGPRAALNTAVAAIAGLVIAISLVCVREYAWAARRTRLHQAGQVPDKAGHRV